MDSIFELSAINNVKDEVGASKVKSTSPVAEVFPTLVQGKSLSPFDSKVVDKSVEYIKDLVGRVIDGDHQAVPELNITQCSAIEPKLVEAIRIFNLMGTYKSVPYDTVPTMRAYKYKGVDSRSQASNGDVSFATYSFRGYPTGIQTISSGCAIDYRKLQSGNFDGTTAEDIPQVQIDIQNKAVYYVISKLYDAPKNAKGVEYFTKSSDITQAIVDEVLKKMRRYGRVNIYGDYSVVSQFNDFAGCRTFGASIILFGADSVAREIRKAGLLSLYNGFRIAELPNVLGFTHINTDKTSYELYMPQSLLSFISQGKVTPLQISRRSDTTTMTDDDIVTRQHLIRSDMEIGVGAAKGMEDWIGFLSDTNFEVPSL